jgi:hypothetical protein
LREFYKESSHFDSWLEDSIVEIIQKVVHARHPADLGLEFFPHPSSLIPHPSFLFTLHTLSVIK